MIVENGSRRYDVGELVAKMAKFRLYLCTVQGEDCQRLLQVATAVEQNGALDRTAYLLGELAEWAQDIETAYAAVKTNPEEMLNYQLCFPELIDSFELTEQGGRRANVLGFRDVPDTRQMVPLSNIVRKDRHRVDLKTSVWIMGRLLKVLAFVHNHGVTVNNVASRNILIEPDKHFVVIFDWSEASRQPEELLIQSVREDIMSAARAVVEVLGGSVETGIPNDGTEAFEPYAQHLIALAVDGERDADTAHHEFYELVDSLWPRAYHPFTSFPL